MPGNAFFEAFLSVLMASGLHFLLISFVEGLKHLLHTIAIGSMPSNAFVEVYNGSFINHAGSCHCNLVEVLTIFIFCTLKDLALCMLTCIFFEV